MNNLVLIPIRRFPAVVLLVALVSMARAAPVSRELAPARGHYARLAELAVHGNDPALDAKRYETPASFVARVEAMNLEFVNVPLERFSIPPAPANSSPQTRAEIDYLLRLQAQRTEKEGERALYFAPWGYSSSIKPEDPRFAAQQKNLFWVGRSIGSWFNADDLPVTANLLGRVWRDASHYMWRLKFKHARIRPYTIDRSVKNLQETEWAAYPSGHASFSHMLAYIYAELAPEFTDIFLTDARDIAHSREIIGVHFPSDSESGRVFARHFVDELFNSPKFQGEFAAMKAEWERVRAALP